MKFINNISLCFNLTTVMQLNVFHHNKFTDGEHHPLPFAAFLASGPVNKKNILLKDFISNISC